MSRKRDKNKYNECQCPKCQKKSNSGISDNPFGINPSQLMGMLGNADMGQIGNILSSMNRDGFDFNNLNLGSIQNMMSGMVGGQNNQELSSMQKMMSGMEANDSQGVSSIQDIITNIGNMQGQQNNVKNSINTNNNKRDNNVHDNSSHHKKSKKNETIDDVEFDENIELLMSIRKIVDYDRAKFIDKVIELYKEGIFEEE